MFKKLMILLLCLTMLISVAACSNTGKDGKKTDDKQSEQKEDKAGEEKKGEKPAEEKKDVRVALVLNGALGDGGNYDDMNRGLQKASVDFGYQVDPFEAREPGMYEEALRAYAQKGYDLIMGTFPGMCEPMDKVAGDFPDVKFVSVYSAGYEFKNKNVTAYDFACWESNYVCGVMAAEISKTGKLGHIIGSEDSNIIANYNAYLKGARTINPEATAERVDAGTFNDAAKGKEIALGLYDKGIDVILGDCAQTTNGIIEAGVERHKYVIGDAVDHSDKGPGTVVMDTYLGFGDAVYDVVKLFSENKLDGQTKFANYANGCIGTIKNMKFQDNVEDKELAAKMPEIWKHIEQVENDIKSGKLVIEKDTEKK